MSNIKTSTWYDTTDHSEVYGIKVLFEGKWLDAGDNDGPLFFNTKEERDAKIIELEKAGIPIRA